MVDSSVISLDSNGAIEAEEDDNGLDLKLKEGARAVAQTVRLRLETVEGEDVWHPDTGLPVASMLGLIDNDFLQSIFTNEALVHPLITDTDNFETEEDAPKRILTVTFDMDLIDATRASVRTQVGT